MHRASAHCIRIGVSQGCRTRQATSRGSSPVVLQVADADLQNPEVLAEMQAVMDGDPTPAPKPETAQELTAQFNRYRQRAVDLKKQRKHAEARKAVRAFAHVYCVPADSSVHMHVHTLTHTQMYIYIYERVCARILRCLR